MSRNIAIFNEKCNPSAFPIFHFESHLGQKAGLYDCLSGHIRRLVSRKKRLRLKFVLKKMRTLLFVRRNREFQSI